jgi:hypothetical protein
MKHSRMSVTGVVSGVVAAVAAAVVAGPLTQPAQAGSSPGYKLQTVTLASGKTTVGRWNPCQTAITYKVNVSGIPTAKRAAMVKQVKSAFVKLAAADGMTYRYTGSTTFVPKKKTLADGPAEIVVAAVSKKATDLDLSENSLGYGGTLWSTWSGSQGEGAAVVRGYVVLSASGMATLKTGFGKGKTQGNVILHELGHATGLEHVSSTKALMNPTLTSSSPNGFSAGDLAGLKKLGRSAGCITIPAIVRIPDLS